MSAPGWVCAPWGGTVWSGGRREGVFGCTGLLRLERYAGVGIRGGGGLMCGGSTSKNRPSHHKYEFAKNFL